MRFLTAVKKSVDYIALAKARDSKAPFTSLFNTLSEKNRYLTKLMVRARGRIYFLEVANIDYIEAAGNYLLIHTGEKEHLIRSTISVTGSLFIAWSFIWYVLLGVIMVRESPGI